MAAGLKKIVAAILENFFSTKFAFYYYQINAKRRLKKCWILSELRQKI
jgi:hypothetical protein